MLVRFHRFRRILLTEQRDWPERLVFAARPRHSADRRRRRAPAPQLQRRRPDARRRVPRRPHRRPLRRRARRRDVGVPAALRRRVRRAALRGRLRLRRRRPARDLPEGRHLALLAVLLHQRCTAASGGWSARSRSTGRSSWSLAPIGLELIRQAIGAPLRRDAPLLPAIADARLADAARASSRPCSAVAIPIKIWNSARIEHRLQEQEKLLMAARIEALAEPDQPALPVQHADVDLVADPLASPRRRGC